jgi:hypothetical protein
MAQAVLRLTIGLGATFYPFVSTETLSSRGVELTSQPNLAPRLQKGHSCITHPSTDNTVVSYRLNFALSGHGNKILIPDPSKGFFLSFYSVHIGSEAHIGS